MPEPLPRSPERMSRHDTGILVVDVQEKLIGHIAGHARLVWNIRRLLDGAQIFGMHAVGTEQYPQGLGPMAPDLASRLGARPQKSHFSCGECAAIFADFQVRGLHRVLVCGIEAHVCVQQTVLDVLATGFRVYVPVDAVGSRGELDRDVALRRMESCGATLTTTEAALFEWCEQSGTPEFKAISKLVKEIAPE